ncbi:hypothetical protein GQ543_08450 [candidate division WOR-3 bacterium]|nr:hypothetical protein [candidate division WOR-3 bacterium]
MFHAFLSSIVMLTCLIQGSDKVQFSIGANYSSYILYQGAEVSKDQWNMGGEIAVHNFIPHIGLKLRDSKVEYSHFPFEGYTYVFEYVPIMLCTSFNMLPFSKSQWLRLSLETGIGLYFWTGKTYELVQSAYIDERDIGFVGGFTLQVKPFKFIVLEYATRYNYIASSDIYKYGFEDKDEKLWENGIGLKIIIP